jgi:alginate O-acetyltransferase complex protein AlgI
MAFFPHLIAGPVLKAKSFFPQIQTKYLNQIDWGSAFESLVTGYFLKKVVADNLHDVTFWLAYPYFLSMGPIDKLVLVQAYSVQIFADFAGYSLIAVGLGTLFGYELMQNFNFPYVSRSVGEFWRRWHISLSTWLRDYLYFPLGGSRRGTTRTCVNLMVVMSLGGLWHGAAWSYALWGAYHGLVLVIERLLGVESRLEDRPAPPTLPAKLARLIGDLFRIAIVFSLITVGWVFFRFTKIQDAIEFFGSLGKNAGAAPNLALLIPAVLYGSPVVLYHLAHLPTLNEKGFENVREAMDRTWKRLRYPVYGGMLALWVLNSGRNEPFIYFQF